jgi:hypothetical protein
MRKRKSPIAKSLVKNSKAAIFAAIEVHNKPIFSYRYEVVVLLFINAWELLLKAYIYKNLKKVKLFEKDGKSKPFLECLKCVISNTGKDHIVLEQNLINIYEYRNKVAHFYNEGLDVIVFSLLSKSLLLYKKFLFEFLNIDISSESDLILLPIGFKKPISPLDFLSNESFIETSSIDVKNYLGGIIESTARLSAEGIQESIFVEYTMNLTNEKRLKNADIIAGIRDENNTGINIIINNVINNPKLSSDAKAVLVKSNSFTVPPKTDEEEIVSWIAMTSKDPKAMPSEDELWRLYSNRHLLKIDDKARLEMARFCILNSLPVFFWINPLKRETIKEFLKNVYTKNRSIFIKSEALLISAFLGIGFYNKLFKKLSSDIYSRIEPRCKNYKTHKPKELYGMNLLESKREYWKLKSEKEFREKLETELTSIAVKGSDNIIGSYNKHEARCFDCYLYSKASY